MENFNTVPDKGTFGGSVEVINQNFSLAQQALEMLDQGAGIIKPYDPTKHSGLGRKILKLKEGGSNVLTQADFDKTNTIYVIQYDFALGEDITVPENCVLEFDGGSISGNKTLTGNNTSISAGIAKIFNTNVTLAGTWNIIKVYPEWFGATGISDDTEAIKKAVALAKDCTVVFSRGRTYKLSDRPEVHSNTEIIIDGLIQNIQYGGFQLFSATEEHGGYTGYHDIYIHGTGTIDMKGYLGRGLEPYAFGSTPISLGHCKNITIEGITIKNWRDGHHAIEVSGSKDVLIKNVKFLGVLNELNGEQCEAIQLERIQQGGTTAIPYDNTITKDVVIDGCVFGKSEECSGFVIAIGEHDDVHEGSETESRIFSNITIKNCVFRDIDDNPNLTEKFFVLRFLSTYRNLTIENNIFENIEKWVLYIGQYSKDIRIKNNLFRNLNNFNEDSFYLAFNEVNTLSIENNIFENIYHKVMNINVSNNVFFKGNIINSTHDYILYIGGNNNNICIENNSFINCDKANANSLVWNGSGYITNYRIVGNYIKLDNENAVSPFHQPGSYFSPSVVFKDNMIDNVSILTTAAKQNLYEQLSRFEYKSESAAMGRNYTLYYTDMPSVTTKGTTANRPKAWLNGNGILSKESNIGIGFTYFDTDLGKPIYVKDIDSSYNVIWVDATGTQL